VNAMKIKTFIIDFLNFLPITEKERDFKNLSEKEKEIVITKTKIRYVFSGIFGGITSALLSSYIKNPLYCLLIGIIVSILNILYWLYINFGHCKKYVLFLLNKFF
jgi:hypothetical protein